VNREPSLRCCWNRSRCGIKSPCSSATDLVARAFALGSTVLDFVLALVAAMARQPDHRPARDSLALASSGTAPAR
jgi:hypothetical protein